MKKLKEKRMKSYVNRRNNLLQEGKQKEAMNMIADGLKYYSNNIINAISPYSAADAGLIVTALRHIANEVEVKNAGAKELAAYLAKNVGAPVLTEEQKTRKPNMQ